MNRRIFLKSAAAAAIAQSLPWRTAFAQDGWRTFETVTRVEVRDSFGVARAWVPLPMEMDTSWQKALGNSWSGNTTTA
ncbi:MAG TPA: transglutaminase, partial [Burkholderiales bacterium]|nr:transglutaminase [Burkholderiales bacterium]